MQKTLNGAHFRKMILAGASLVEENKKHIDELNVFPVPDGDTGTNMSLTLKSVVAEVNACENNNLNALGEAVTKGALKGARGNSGVILSQILKGICSGFSSESEITTKEFAKALTLGSEVAYKAVTKPKEGTILTVIRVMAEEATSLAKKHSEFEEFFKLVLEKGEEILKLTPEMLPVLKKAGVVDAGGRGLIVMFSGFYRVIANDETLVLKLDGDTIGIENKDIMDNQHIVNYADLSDIEFAYCTEFFVINMHKKTTETDIDKLRDHLIELGDSVVCIGDLSLVKVHVHTNEPSRALGYALELGELNGIKIENMLEQNRALRNRAASASQKPFGLLSIAAGEGITAIFNDLGVDSVLSGGQTMNPSANDIAEAVSKINAANIFVFPNNKNIIMAAEQAKNLTKKPIFVVPTRTIPEGISAVLAFNNESTLEGNFECMTESAKNVLSGAVTYAVRTASVDEFELKEGDIIGLSGKSIATKGNSISATTQHLVEKMITDNSFNITMFYGEDVTESDAQKLCETLMAKYPDKDFSAIYGGQPVYFYIISVE